MAVLVFVAWEFLSVIYEFRWDKLIANNDNRSFRQCVSLQFNKNITTKKLFKSKQANISRVPLPISLKPSKSMLTKLKFYKKN